MLKLLLLLTIQVQLHYTPDSKIDSLKGELKNLHLESGSSKNVHHHFLLREIMKAYSDQNIDSSFLYSARLIALCKSPALRNELAYAYQYAGYLYQVRGDFHQSIQSYYDALKTAEELSQFKQAAGAHRGIAHAYSSLKEFERAGTHCRLGLAALKKEPDAYTELGILNVQGANFREEKKFASSLKTNNAMYLLARNHREAWYESQGLHAIGWVYMEMRDIRKALDYFKKALSISRQIGSVDLECSILLHISDSYAQTKNWVAALRFCNEAKQKAHRINNSSIVNESQKKLYQIYKSTGQFSRSLYAYEDFVTLRDTLAKERADQRIENLRAKYDNAKKTAELKLEKAKRAAETSENKILALTRNVLYAGISVALLVATLLFVNNRRLQDKNIQIETQHHLLETARTELADMNKTLEVRVSERTEELSSANAELVRKNEEIKEALFKGQKIERKRVALELHDNLSSLLTAVNMSMQAINPKNLSEFEQSVYGNVRQMIQSAYSEVRNISHNIAPAELENDGLILTLASLVNKMNQTSGLRLTMTAEQLTERLPREIEFNLYSIIFELMNNTIRHAEAKNLRLMIMRTSYGVELSVTDDGIGLFPSQGKRGTGLQNIQTRLESLGGTFETLVPKERGTWILIKIPIETVSFNGNSAA